MGHEILREQKNRINNMCRVAFCYIYIRKMNNYKHIRDIDLDNNMFSYFNFII